MYSKMQEVKARALDYSARAYALKGSYADAAEIWEARMAMAKTSLERTYLFHEIGRCYLGKTSEPCYFYLFMQKIKSKTCSF